MANDAVKTAHAGDFVKIAGDFYHIIKTNPTVADDLLKGSGQKYEIQHHLLDKLLYFQFFGLYKFLRL
jgi:hypothetical protein